MSRNKIELQRPVWGVERSFGCFVGIVFRPDELNLQAAEVGSHAGRQIIFE